jgi:predicted dehydrogenase
MTGVLRVGLVGCGRLAAAGYVPAFARVAGARIVAVADPDAARRDAVSALASGPVTTHADVGSLLDDARPDAVVLATPVQHHLDDARAASEAGVPALLEKPPAPDATTAAALTTLALPPWVGFNRRFDPGAARVRAQVMGRTGLALRFVLSYRRRSWSPVQVDDDALLDLGPHLVDWARWITAGDLDDVHALELRHEHAVLRVRTRCGVATLVATTDARHQERIDVHTTSGALVARHRRGGVVDAVRGRLPGADHPLVTTLAAEVDEFTHVVRDELPSRLGTAADGLAVMQVLDAARASAATTFEKDATPC